MATTSTKKTKTTAPKKASKKTSATTGDSLKTQVTSLEEKVSVLQESLQALTTILEQEFRSEIPQGPRQIATKIKNAGLLENT